MFSFIVDEKTASPLKEFDLPKGVRIICLYRNDQLVLPEETDHLETDDEVILITWVSQLPELKRRWKHAPGHWASNESPDT